MHPNAREITFRWTYDGKAGSCTMPAGTLRYLGLDAKKLNVGETTFTKAEKPYKRRLYPGGPTIDCVKKAGTFKRILGGNVSTAKSASTMYLEAGEHRDTVRLTGSKRAFSKWLNEEVAIVGTTESVVLKNFNGRTYAVLWEGISI